VYNVTKWLKNLAVWPNINLLVTCFNVFGRDGSEAGENNSEHFITAPNYLNRNNIEILTRKLQVLKLNFGVVDPYDSTLLYRRNAILLLLVWNT
jgi:hypothetical protein